MFDLDGVLIEGEEVWDAVRHELVRARGGHWVPEATAAMMGMSSPEWSRYMAGELGVPRAPAAIVAEIIAGVEARYAAALPLVEGAVEVVRGPRATSLIPGVAMRRPAAPCSSTPRASRGGAAVPRPALGRRP